MKKITRNSTVVLLVLTLLVMAGCSAKRGEISSDGSSVTNAPDVTSIPTATVAPTVSLKEEFKEVPENAVFNVNWDTEEGEYSAGTSFTIKTDLYEEPLLITAFHLFGSEEGFSGADMSDYVKGGKLTNALTGDEMKVTVKKALVIKDAAPVPDVAHDVAAFELSNTAGLTPFTFATEPCKVGDTVYLLAYLYETDDIHENGIYEGTVVSDEDGVVHYEMDESYGTNGASGAPVVNIYGEVVGIHIGSNASLRFAHSAESIYEQLAQALKE